MQRWNHSEQGESPTELKKEPCLHAAQFRRVQKSIKKLEELRERIGNAHLQDKSQAFNTARLEALELDNLLEIAEATAVSAEGRKESRVRTLRRLPRAGR